MQAPCGREREITPGEKVLLKNTKTTGKLAPNFEQEPYTVLTRNGSEVTVEAGDGAVYRRNSSFVKQYIPPADDVAEDSKSSEEIPSAETDAEPAEGRPKRTIKLPGKYKDFVMNKT